jgi:hypothetical protein
MLLDEKSSLKQQDTRDWLCSQEVKEKTRQIRASLVSA